MELSRLSTIRLGREFLWLDEVDSTNDYIKSRMDALPDGFTLAADYQTAGKGTRQRQWGAAPGSSLMFSFLTREVCLSGLPLLPLLAGLAVCETVSAVTGQAAAIKWPNDVVCMGRKLCGILCESRVEGKTASAIVGIGVNLTQTKEEFERLDLVYAGSLYMVTGEIYEPPVLAAEILNRFERMLEELRVSGFRGALRERYKNHCAVLGREARFQRDGAETTAFVRDIAEDGALVVESDSGTGRVYAGDVSVRGLYGYV